MDKSMAGQQGAINPSKQLEMAAIHSLASPGSLFTEGFSSPWHQQQNAVPWATVQQLLTMARDALAAKQQAAEVLLREVDQLKKSVDGDTLLQRAQRAEVDSRLLLEELQVLMLAKANVAQQRADLDRANALLMAERELLCEQLDVSPDNINLCQAVQKVLAAAKRAQGLEGQLRMLARCQRNLLLQLEVSREQEARAARHWQACEDVYQATLAAHGIPTPELPLLPMQQFGGSMHTSNTVVAQNNNSGAVTLDGSSSSCHSHSTASSTPALLRLNHGLADIAAAAAGFISSERRLSAAADNIAGSPAASHAHLLPATPPASDINLAGDGPLQLRRSNSLDSGLHSLTGLLDQLALGQLGSDDLAEYDCDDSFERDSGDCDHWMLVDAMSDEAPPGPSHTRDQADSSTAVGGTVAAPSSAGDHAAAAAQQQAAAAAIASDDNAAGAAAMLLLLGGSGGVCSHGQVQQLQLKHQLVQQKQLQTVEEVQEDQDSSEPIAAA